MGSRSIQFHATPEELLAFAAAAAHDLRPRIVATEFPPERSFDVTSDGLSQVFANPKVSSLAFVFGERGSEAAQRCDIDDAITMQIARPKENELRQSALGTRSDKPTTLAAWKTISDRIRKITCAGVIVRHPLTGEHAVDRNFRLTEGARTLARKGTTMLPFAGTNHIEFDDSK